MVLRLKNKSSPHGVDEQGQGSLGPVQKWVAISKLAELNLINFFLLPADVQPQAL